MTEPSRPPDPSAVPGGSVTRIVPQHDEETARSLRRENESARVLARQGYDVEQNPKTPGVKRPDYLIEGEVFDNYAPRSSRARNIWDETRKKVVRGQTSRVVLNLNDSAVKTSDLRDQFRQQPIDRLDEVLVVRRGDVLRLFP